MNKNGLLVLLSLIVVFSVIGMAAAEEAALPQPGDEISGFMVQSVAPEEALNATAVLFEHVKTGAKLLYLASEDMNRSFDITFRTPTLDDTGKPHVFEHISLCGSQKYPANLFFPISNQTYNTYANALTSSGMTTFPVASLSEQQLMTIMDYYLSGVFFPLLYDEPRLVEQEAWRYEMSGPDEPLTIVGTVYSEMQGVNAPADQAYYNNRRTAFENGLTAHNHGGTIDSIPELTWKSLTDFHSEYYHPSNALIILYGKMDYAAFMAHIDGYLSKFEKKDVYVERGRVQPYTRTLYKTYDIPVEADAQTENASYIYYSFAMDGATLEDCIQALLCKALLELESSPLTQSLRQAFPSAMLSIETDIDMPTPLLSIVASGVNADDQTLFVQIVDSALEKISCEGFSKDDVDAVRSSFKMDLLLTTEDMDLGVNAGENIARCWAYFDRTDFYACFEKAIENMNAEQILNCVNKWLLNNSYRAVSVSRPVAGLAEENEARLEKQLADRKASMTEEEIDALVRQTAEFAEWAAAEPPAELLGQILNITPDLLPEKLAHYDVNDETRDGVRYLTSETAVDGIAYINLLLDASAIPVNQLCDAELALWLLNEMDTRLYTKEELYRLVKRYMPELGLYIYASNSYAKDGADQFHACIEYKTLSEDIPESIALLEEMLLNSVFDAETARSFLNRQITFFEESLNSDITGMMSNSLGSSFNTVYAFNNAISGFNLYAHIKEMLLLEDGALIERLEAARDILLNRSGAAVFCAGDAEAIQLACGDMAPLLAKLPDELREKVDYSVLRNDIVWEAMVMNSTVQTNLLMAPMEDYSGKDAVIDYFIGDTYLYPQLRNVRGAYGTACQSSPFFQLLGTYQDPNLAETFGVFEVLPEYLRTAEITQDMVDAYIIGSYSGLSRPVGILSGAIGAIDDYLLGLTEKQHVLWMQEAKQTKAEDIRAAADRIQAMLDNSVRCTAASAVTIVKNKELFTSVVSLNDPARQTAE